MPGRKFGRGHRVDRFERAHVRKPGIGREQAVQPRGSRAHRPHHDHWPRERALSNSRMLGKDRLGIEPVLEHLEQLPDRGEVPQVVEPRLVAQRRNQLFERPAKPRIAEIIQAGLRAQSVKQGIGIELRPGQDASAPGGAQRGICGVDKPRTFRKLCGRDHALSESLEPIGLFLTDARCASPEMTGRPVVNNGGADRLLHCSAGPAAVCSLLVLLRLERNWSWLIRADVTAARCVTRSKEGPSTPRCATAPIAAKAPEHR